MALSPLYKAKHTGAEIDAAVDLAKSAYQKPKEGIPGSDLAHDIQASLERANSALQAHQVIAEGQTNGTISVGGVDVNVHGLGSAAYTESSAYDKAGTGAIEAKKVDDKVNTLQGQVDGLDSDVTLLEGRMGTAESNIGNIEKVVPQGASETNQLTTQDFVNSSINNMAAFYITKNAEGDPFESVAELKAATTLYSGGVERVPTRNDYAIVKADETSTIKDDLGNAPTTRYSYQGTGTYNGANWQFQYVVNRTALTDAQLKAINSGVTDAVVSQVNTNKGDIAANKTAIDANVANISKNAQAISTLQTATANMYSKSDVYTKTETESAIQAATPAATASVAGLSKLGAEGGAARYEDYVALQKQVDTLVALLSSDDREIMFVKAKGQETV